MEQDDNLLTSTSTSQAQSFNNNEIRVTLGGPINRLVQICLDKLKHDSIVVIAKGKSIQKAVTVVEIVKRQIGLALHQYNQLGKVASDDQWELAVDGEVDNTASIPILIIRLSTTAMPELETTATYQSPHQPE